MPTPRKVVQLTASTSTIVLAFAGCLVLDHRCDGSRPCGKWLTDRCSDWRLTHGDGCLPHLGATHNLMISKRERAIAHCLPVANGVNVCCGFGPSAIF